MGPKNLFTAFLYGGMLGYKTPCEILKKALGNGCHARRGLAQNIMTATNLLYGTVGID
jgi:hypothetical protein